MNYPNDAQIQAAYNLAQERYALLGVDTDQALATLSKVALSLHCWQGDDVGGFESAGGELTGGIAATGNYPGRARTPAELRRDLDKTYSLIPGQRVAISSAEIPSTTISLWRPAAPATRRTALRETSSSSANSLIRAVLAAPPTGGAATRACSMPSSFTPSTRSTPPRGVRRTPKRTSVRRIRSAKRNSDSDMWPIMGEVVRLATKERDSSRPPAQLAERRAIRSGALQIEPDRRE